MSEHAVRYNASVMQSYLMILIVAVPFQHQQGRFTRDMLQPFLPQLHESVARAETKIR